MDKYLGDFAANSSVVFNFNTAAFSDGSPITLAGTPSLAVYKDSTTEITTGITLTVDYDAKTGMHHVVIDLSASASYTTATDFSVVIAAGTVGGTSVVGREIACFSINNRSALRPATPGRTLVVDASGLADANTVKVGPSGSGTAQTARDLGASVLLSVGTGTGQVNLSSGKVPVVQLVAADFAAAALNGKGDWLLASNAPANFSSLSINGSGLVSSILGNVAHGGVAATITFERLIGASTTTNQPCLSLTGNGTGQGIFAKGGATASGIRAEGGGTSGHGIHGVSSPGGGGAGIRGESSSAGGYGIYGIATGIASFGIQGESQGISGGGIQGIASLGTGIRANGSGGNDILLVNSSAPTLATAIVGAAGAALTALAPASTALSSTIYTNARAANLDNLDAAVSAVVAQLVKVLAAVYDSATSNGSNQLTLSNGHTQTFDSSGNRTTS